MDILWSVCKVMFILGIGGIAVSLAMMLGWFLTQCPLWLTIATSCGTIVAGLLIGKRVEIL